MTATSNLQRMPDKNRLQVVIEENEPIIFSDDRRIGTRIFNETIGTLQAFMGTGGNNTPMVAQNPSNWSLLPVGVEWFSEAGMAYDEETMLLDIQRVGDIRIYNPPVQSLQARMGTGGNSTPMVVEPMMQVRRLTPLECERLMGWSDDHTRWKEDGTEQADSHRYKQCGNGVAAPVARWIGEQIMKIVK